MPKPTYLFADSRLLFWTEDGRPFCRRLRMDLGKDRPVAAYIGASNCDEPAFFDLFRSAMAAIEVTDCRMINACFAAEDAKCLETADLILLAGGDFERGWNIFNAVGMAAAITAAYSRGASLIGVSAGAVQLGLGGYVSTERTLLVRTFGIVPFIISAHQEQNDWRDLRRAVTAERGSVRGIGLPAGSGMIYDSERIVEPLRGSLREFTWTGSETKCDLLLPGAALDRRTGSAS